MLPIDFLQSKKKNEWYSDVIRRANTKEDSGISSLSEFHVAGCNVLWYIAGCLEYVDKHGLNSLPE